MQAAEPVSDSTAIDLARECLYRFLAAALSDPYAGTWSAVLNPDNQRLAREATDLLRAEASRVSIALDRGEVAPHELDLDHLLAELRRPADELRAEYDRVFGLVAPRECPPYETEYHPTTETFFRSQQLADIAGFYRAFGLEPAKERPERPDHIALELEFMAFLLTKKRRAQESSASDPDAMEHTIVCDDAQRKFFRDHIAWWIPAFATGLRRKAGRGFYAPLGGLLAALVPVERRQFGVVDTREPVQPDLIERPEEQSGCSACPLQL
jgi:putative dimethyl sulfoxide reductase chaperone